MRRVEAKLPSLLRFEPCGENHRTGTSLITDSLHKCVWPKGVAVEQEKQQREERISRERPSTLPPQVSNTFKGLDYVQKAQSTVISSGRAPSSDQMLHYSLSTTRATSMGRMWYVCVSSSTS